MSERNDRDPAPADPSIRELIDDMMRLGMREYSEVGIPMFLVAEDLRSDAVPKPAAEMPWRDVAALFTQRAQTLRDHKPDMTAADLARLVEIFADRYLIATTVPAFSAIPEALARRRRTGDPQ